MKHIKTFEQFLAEQEALNTISLFEHKKYKRIPGTANSYREDAGNTNTKTIKHSHIYAKQDGKGKELYAINIDGKGHDGSSGIEIPKSHADYFRSVGYNIADNNILEDMDLNELDNNNYSLILMYDK